MGGHGDVNHDVKVGTGRRSSHEQECWRGRKCGGKRREITMVEGWIATGNSGGGVEIRRRTRGDRRKSGGTWSDGGRGRGKIRG